MKIILIITLLLTSSFSIAEQYNGSRQIASQEEISGSGYNKIFIYNSCHKDIHVAVIFHNLRELWQVRAWVNISAGEKVQVAKTKAPRFYYYAESLDGQTQWKGKEFFTIAGGEFGFSEIFTNMVRNRGNYTQTISCD